MPATYYIEHTFQNGTVVETGPFTTYTGAVDATNALVKGENDYWTGLVEEVGKDKADEMFPTRTVLAEIIER